MSELEQINDEIVRCSKCPRLVAWRQEAARLRPRRYADWEYWARPVPGFGDPRARVLVVGLAPAAHGGNRTGRIFTGDRSGNWLFAALHRCGFANRAESERRGDGLRLKDAYVTAVNLIGANRAAVEEIATRLAEKRELYGDELVDLLDAQELVQPELDYTKEETWPTM